MAGSTITSGPAGRRRSANRRRSRTRKRGPSRRPAATGGSRKRTRRTKGWSAQRLWPGLLLVVAVLVGVAWDSQDKGVPAVPGDCTVAGLPMTLTTEQLANAATIARVGRDRGLPERAVVIALATAQQESRLRNLDYGDRDSLGLFQQRPSAGWGTDEQVQDPVYAANAFYDRLVEVPGWEVGDLAAVSDAVQRSAFPRAPARWEEMATKLAAAQVSELPDQIVCTADGAAAG